jgi:uncharacterized protein (DUF1697 family)
MEHLRAFRQELGMKNVRTYLQSGNVVFEAKGSASNWAAALEKKLTGETRLPVSVLVRTAAEMDAILAGNPFLKEASVDTARLAVTFLERPASNSGIKTLQAWKGSSEHFHSIGKEIYLHCPNGFGKSKLYTPDKALSQRTTTRNWTTVANLCKMAAPPVEKVPDRSAPQVGWAGEPVCAQVAWRFYG